MNPNTALWLALGAAVLAVLYGVITVSWVLKLCPGNARMQEIAGAIQEGAKAYMNRQYTTIAIAGVVLFVVLGFAAQLGDGDRLRDRRDLLGPRGLHRHVRVGTRQRAHRASRNQGPEPRAHGGVPRRRSHRPARRRLGPAGRRRVLRCCCTHAGTSKQTILKALVGLAFGGSLISIFARLGGGIFTKGADVGADLVGKVEAGIPEDDPRNPAVIADNVGDNVGDCAGMAADLFETYAVTLDRDDVARRPDRVARSARTRRSTRSCSARCRSSRRSSARSSSARRPARSWLRCTRA